MLRIIAKIKNFSFDRIFFEEENICLSDTEELLFRSMADRYRRKEPVSKIINRRSFWKDDFFINADVLDPRPETELIVETVLSEFEPQSALNFLDAGTGSGCILLSLLREYKNAQGVGIDFSSAAAEVAERNRKELNIENAIFIAADWNNFNGLPGREEMFDVIVSNPPYVKTEDIPLLDESVRNYDPPAALDGGKTGTEAYVSLSLLARRLLKPNGSVFWEIGYGQAAEVLGILRDNGFEPYKTVKDLAGTERVIAAHIVA
ncbi:MAG: peptide chain release factor N(5)-glutamine methyltransferase [Holosporaceae bacterium]|jgi:release factor glutamine methyltransferase|nr:peptide chain release factor N(5)-glutamine methyltransferase [Holosporaceae bacterium]